MTVFYKAIKSEVTKFGKNKVCLHIIIDCLQFRLNMKIKKFLENILKEFLSWFEDFNLKFVDNLYSDH